MACTSRHGSRFIRPAFKRIHVGCGNLWQVVTRRTMKADISVTKVVHEHEEHVRSRARSAARASSARTTVITTASPMCMTTRRVCVHTFMRCSAFIVVVRPHPKTHDLHRARLITRTAAIRSRPPTHGLRVARLPPRSATGTFEAVREDIYYPADSNIGSYAVSALRLRRADKGINAARLKSGTRNISMRRSMYRAMAARGRPGPG